MYAAKLTRNSKVLTLLATGYRHDATKIIVHQVLTPRGLIGLATDTLDYSTVEIRELFGLLAGVYRHRHRHRHPRYYRREHESEHEHDGEDYGYYDYEVEYGDGEGEGEGEGDGDEEKSTYPLLIHCTQGKDRTGLIVILLLLLLLSPESQPSPSAQLSTQPSSTEAQAEAKAKAEAKAEAKIETAIKTDYTRSEPELHLEADERLAELAELGIPANFLECPPRFPDAVGAHLRDRYGGVVGYLEYIGVGGEVVEGVRKGLLLS